MDDDDVIRTRSERTLPFIGVCSRVCTMRRPFISIEYPLKTTNSERAPQHASGADDDDGLRGTHLDLHACTVAAKCLQKYQPPMFR